jgi:hypothetical protein
LFNMFQRGGSTTNQQLMSWIATSVSWRVLLCSGKAQVSGSSDAESPGQMYFSSPRDWNGQLDWDPELIIYQGSNGSESRCF